jgi:TolA-binding protein
MSQDQTIQFLQATFQGYDPNTRLSSLLQGGMQALGDNLCATTDGAVQTELKVLEQVKAVSERVITNLMNTEQELQQQLEDCQQKICVLQGVQSEQEKTLLAKQEEERERNKHIQALKANLAAFRASASVPPPPSETERCLVDFGQQAVNNIGKK